MHVADWCKRQIIVKCARLAWEAETALIGLGRLPVRVRYAAEPTGQALAQTRRGSGL